MENVVEIFKRLQHSLEKNDAPTYIFKPKQVLCMEYLLKGHDVVAVLPTGFGKSLIFQYLCDVLPLKCTKNIIIVISPLNAIIEDQVNSLNKRGVPVAVLNTEGSKTSYEKLFVHDDEKTKQEGFIIPKNIAAGKLSILFAHPEAILNESGRRLLKSKIYQDNVVACVIDEAHCVDMW